ncbi:MAG: membrane-associated phospholipid phosphatase [Saprospiraceae bacterium]|jgi:membrane-associated phospholipid phosphatase
MLSIIKSNQLFFSAFISFIIIGGILLAKVEQGEAIYFFSAHRSVFGDFFFRYFTKLGEEPVYIFFVSLFLFIRFRYALLIPLTGAVGLGFSYILKVYFAHDRPFSFFSKTGMIDQINLVEGVDLFKAMTSFPSGHTLSAFAVFGLVAFLFPKKKYLGLLMFCCALLVGISRIYLVQHFLKDIYLGGILGVLLAMLIYWLQGRFPINETNWIDRSFRTKKEVDKA